ncbi:hypothetical protein JNUCC0626_05915 [Lentzea sp. JNUCC 0626]|uniref:hypothetical protein n=1 Tax=Lentzea sp. JNUCC 0626 TaxID=3367513 RepID=UPI003748E4D6
MRKAPLLVTIAAVVTGLLTPAASAAADCTWQIRPLPVEDGMDWSNLRITGVDAQGNASGFHTTRGKLDHALTRWTADRVEVLPKPKGATAFVTIAGNASGVVIGRVELDDGTEAFMTHTPGVGYQELPVPAGYDPELITLTDINDRGDVLAKWWGTRTLPQAGLLWPGDGGAPVVITVPDVQWPDPVAIRNDRTILFGSGDGVWLWRDGVATSLGDWGYTAHLRDITRDGVVASREYEQPRTSSLWRESTGVMEKIDGVLEEVNEDGIAVGYLDDGNYTYAVWRGATFDSLLPSSPGASDARADVVGASGVIGGFSGTKPVVWTCR